MYLFISSSQNMYRFRSFTADYIYDKDLNRLKIKVLKYIDKYSYPKDEPKGKWVFQKRYGAVVEKFTGDIGGWIVKL